MTKCLCGTPKCKGYLGLRPTNITLEEWEQRLECMTCEICLKNYENDDVTLIICDLCNNGFHIYCVTPPLQDIPKDAFYCDGCKARLESEAAAKLTKQKAELLEKKERVIRERQAPQDPEENEPEDYKRLMELIESEERKAIQTMYFGEDDPSVVIKRTKIKDEEPLSASKQRQEQVQDLGKKAHEKFD